MALENVMRVDGGHIVTGGGAGGNSVEIDWEDWCELTPEEQETGDWTIINCPWADGNVSVDLMTKLWENPDPSASFVAQNITLASDDYDLLLILSSYSTTNVRMAPASIGLSGYLNFADNSSSSALAMYRAYTASGNKVTFTDNYRNGTVANGYLIPRVIYGIKLTVSVKINAIAMDVSTSADKCMLSENESVKDRIGNILFVEKSISNKSISTAWGSMFTANEVVDITDLGLSNAPDVVSVTFGTTDARIALCAAASINKNNINVSLLRAESGTVSGKIIITLKSNG